jgi:hypothetical protein
MHVNRSVVAAVSALISLSLIPLVVFAQGDDSSTILGIDHYVPVVSTVSPIAGKMVQIYVGERNHMLLYDASLKWFWDGVVKGVDSGELRLGY